MKLVEELRQFFSLKKLEVPETNETKLVDAVQMWEVRWSSRHGRWSEDPSLCSAQPELECFTSESTARDFAESLDNAFALLRYSGSGTGVTVRKAGADVISITGVRKRA